MAGSYRHITDKDNNFIGLDFVENLGDAEETIEEMFDMILYLARGDKAKIHEAWLEGHIRRKLPNARGRSYNEFWGDE